VNEAHVSTKCHYAIKALVRLAAANGKAPVRARDIAQYGGIPPKYLEQVMHDLRQAGLVTSRRGKDGGYLLARDPAEITFSMVREVVDGSAGGIGRMRSDDQAEALVAPVWQDVRRAVRAVLDAATIADAAARAASSPMYYI
jgi:Rrf2 family cysteine metabolism transcriptional repressor